jgi:hypothetical protein
MKNLLILGSVIVMGVGVIMITFGNDLGIMGILIGGIGLMVTEGMR